MSFPENWSDFLNDYSFDDSKEVYTNGSRLIPVFRVEQLIEHLLKAQEPPKNASISSAIECLLHPQDADDSDMAKAIDTAVRAMRSLIDHEPRVMALEELDNLRGRGRAVWFEDRDAFAKCQDVFFVVASGIHAYFKGETYSMLKMVDAYGRSWRCWTARPTEAQREAKPWA